MLLAVRKDEGSVPGGGFHYMLHPIEIASPREADLWRLMRYEIVEVEDERGKQLLADSRAALKHQVEVAFLVDGPDSKRVEHAS